jgi:hypothetical protein
VHAAEFGSIDVALRVELAKPRKAISRPPQE